jgi:hypothetical protein
MPIDADAVSRYRRDGYLVVEDLFSPAEVEAMREASGEGRAANTWDAKDNEGRTSMMSIWSELGDDVWGAASTCPRVVNGIRTLLGEDIAFFHGKIIFKSAGTPGSVEWHQDYGYWYEQGFVFPRMMSTWVALDDATTENGCLEVLRGSHLLGRLDHKAFHTQMGADPKRLEQVRGNFEHVRVTMRAGSGLFFDCNLLHGSGPNLSPRDRRAFIMCYNALANPCLNPGAIRDRRPCPVSADDAILRAAGRLSPA